jgi:hypothetical protein
MSLRGSENSKKDTKDTKNPKETEKDEMDEKNEKDTAATGSRHWETRRSCHFDFDVISISMSFRFRCHFDAYNFDVMAMA